MNNDKGLGMGQDYPIENIHGKEDDDLSYVTGLRLTLVAIVFVFPKTFRICQCHHDIVID